MGAGTGACNNLVRSLRAGAQPVELVGCHDDRFTLRQSGADRLYLIPPQGTATFDRALLGLVEHERIELVIPSSDGDVLALSRLRRELGPRCFLPEAAVIDRCQDKLVLTELLDARGLPVAPTRAVRTLADLPGIFEALGAARPLWCRVRTGSRSLGAAPVDTVSQAEAWIRYWHEMRDVPPESFTLSEFLPGRDYMCMSLWQDGRMVLVTTFEKLSYFGADASPSGMSSLSSLAKTVIDPRLVDVCGAAIRALSPSASGAFSVDLKEDREGRPCITEINAGRFFIGMTAFDPVSRHGIAPTFLRLARGAPVELDDPYVTPPDHYVVRDLDTLPGVYTADQLFESIVPWGRSLGELPSS